MAGDDERWPIPRETLSSSQEADDSTKLTLNDAIFEVLEAASGKERWHSSRPRGFGPESFDTVFSVGDFLICVRDGARVTVYSSLLVRSKPAIWPICLCFRGFGPAGGSRWKSFEVV